MKLLNLLLFLIMTSTTAQFNFGTQHNTDVWRVVNDDVMGGVSKSKVEVKENSILFSGTTSLDNNGGFSSIRTTFPKGDLKDCKTMTIKFRSPNTNRSFGLSLKDSQKYYIPYYKFMFQPKSDDWQVLKVNLKDFGYYKISEKIGNEMPLDFLEDVFNIALILSDGKEGTFQIEIDYIRFD